MYEWWSGMSSVATGRSKMICLRTGDANAHGHVETNVMVAGTVTDVTPVHSARTAADTWRILAGTTARPARYASAAVFDGSHGTHSSEALHSQTQ